MKGTYSTSKSGVVLMAETLADALGPNGTDAIRLPGGQRHVFTTPRNAEVSDALRQRNHCLARPATAVDDAVT
jgi:NAD(P)-dependent dehydrogenase (short-subunit alcohol dehydrogenase family)